MSDFRYKLTFEVKEYGNRTFTAEREFDSNDFMGNRIADDIALALKATMSNWPSSLVMASAMESDCLSQIYGLGVAYEAWDGACDFEDCIKVVVDVKKLCGGDDPVEVERVKERLRKYGIEDSMDLVVDLVGLSKKVYCNVERT